MATSISDEEPTNNTSGIVPRTRPPPPKTVTQTRVIVCDDDNDHRELVACLLRCDGYEVVEARDGREVLDYLATPTNNPPALIVTDVRMSEVGGLELVERLRDNGDHTPVVLMTSVTERALRLAAEALGILALFVKPFDMDDLRTAVLIIAEPSRAI